MYIEKDGGGSTSLIVNSYDLNENGTLVIPADVMFFFEDKCYGDGKLKEITVPAESKVNMSWHCGNFRNNSLESVVIKNIHYKRIVIRNHPNGYPLAYLVPSETYADLSQETMRIYQAYQFKLNDGILSPEHITVCESVDKDKVLGRGVGRNPNEARRDLGGRFLNYDKMCKTKMTTRMSVDRAFSIYALLTCYGFTNTNRTAQELAITLCSSGMVSEKSGAVKVRNLTFKEFLCRMSVVDPAGVQTAIKNWNAYHDGTPTHGAKSEQVSLGNIQSNPNDPQTLGDCINCKLLKDMNIADVAKKCMFAKTIHR